MTRTSTTLRFALLITMACGFLDAYTYLARGHVFANAQTGNVIFFALGVTGRNWGQALLHLWAILAFMLGVVLSAHIKSGRLDRPLHYPLRWAMATQAVTLAVIGFVPATVSPTWVNVPISFVTADADRAVPQRRRTELHRRGDHRQPDAPGRIGLRRPGGPGHESRGRRSPYTPRSSPRSPEAPSSAVSQRTPGASAPSGSRRDCWPSPSSCSSSTGARSVRSSSEPAASGLPPVRCHPPGRVARVAL